ncbi:ABC transporter ATP-binding protein [Novosphingobium sp. ERW19]|uniref:ABC transporter ATP-binding protein n=1 Tax=Novosphingobium sp. ERW19 TaxID=2726186 RepID=UPI001F0D1173|nr:ABC transporter ATP-binding protein [Novosphingobium sp. ERW19]
MMLEALGVSIPHRLHGVTAQLRAGGVTAIVGPNGAGKSTLLAALAGLIEPATGTVTLASQPLAQMLAQERARRIGYLPQSGEVAWNLAVRTLVSLGRLPHRASPAEDAEAVAQAITTMQLEPLADRALSTLSGGERARALLARVLATQPHWILADEPLAALDLAHQQALICTLRGRAEEGRGVVLVVHDLALAMNHADHVVVLDGGRVAAQGKPRDALSQEVIARVWNLDARWLGEPGHMALAM